jgi:large subunit ribosomal protein L15
MRLPKRGFTRVKAPLQIVNVGALERFDAGTEVTVELLAREGLVRRADQPVKLLGDGELTKALTIDLDAVSRGAAQAVAAAGGTVKGAAAEESA